MVYDRFSPHTPQLTLHAHHQRKRSQLQLAQSADVQSVASAGAAASLPPAAVTAAVTAALLSNTAAAGHPLTLSRRPSQEDLLTASDDNALPLKQLTLSPGGATVLPTPPVKDGMAPPDVSSLLSAAAVTTVPSAPLPGQHMTPATAAALARSKTVAEYVLLSLIV